MATDDKKAQPNQLENWVNKYVKEGGAVDGVSIDLATGERKMMTSLLPAEGFVYDGERAFLEQVERDYPALKGAFGF